MNIQDSIIFFMEILGTIAFAASGAMVGIRKDVYKRQGKESRCFPGEDPLDAFPVRIRPDDLRQSPHRLPRYGLPPSRIPVHGAVFCRFHPSFFASYLHHKTYPVLLWIPDKEEGSLPGNLSDPFPAALFSYCLLYTSLLNQFLRASCICV